MTNNKIAKTLVENAVRHGIREIREDPRRSIRKLVDLGSHFSNGRFQQSFFEMSEKMLSEPDSEYYDLVSNVANGVDETALETFGVNLAYNGWTCGAKTIRQKQTELGCPIPWAVFLNYGRECAAGVDIESVVLQCADLGICTFMVFAGTAGDTEYLLTAVSRFRDCAFFIFSDSPAVSAVLAQYDGKMDNVMAVIRCGQSDFDVNIKLLREKKRLFAVSAEYGGDSEDQIISGRMTEELMKYDFDFLFLAAAPGCSPETKEKVYRYVTRSRKEQEYPVFLVELMRDYDFISRVISDEKCMLGIRSDGTVFGGENSEDMSVKDMPVETVLQRMAHGADSGERRA